MINPNYFEGFVLIILCNNLQLKSAILPQQIWLIKISLISGRFSIFIQFNLVDLHRLVQRES